MNLAVSGKIAGRIRGGIQVKFIPVVMIREHLRDLPGAPVPEGFLIRHFQRKDISFWADIETSVGEFADTAKAHARFSNEFGPHIDHMKERCLFLTDEKGYAIGTTTAWFNRDFLSGDYGRVHWVAVRPVWQGKGLGRLLVTKALELMTRWHEKAYLTTQTTSWIAIRLYLDMGFRPFITKAEEEEGWQLLKKKIASPLLETPYLKMPGSKIPDVDAPDSLPPDQPG